MIEWYKIFAILADLFYKIVIFVWVYKIGNAVLSLMDRACSNRDHIKMLDETSSFFHRDSIHIAARLELAHEKISQIDKILGFKLKELELGLYLDEQLTKQKGDS